MKITDLLVLLIALALLPSGGQSDASALVDLEIPPHHEWELVAYFQDRARRRARGLLGELEHITTDAHTFPKSEYLKVNMTGRLKRSQADSEGLSEVAETSRRRVHCQGTVGTWCRDFVKQPKQEVKPAPRGDKACKNNCTNVGVCNYDIGVCQCPAGWDGDDCSTPRKRPCTNRIRTKTDPIDMPVSHIDNVTKEDRNWLEMGWMASRCAGICDEDLGLCYCGQNSTYRRVLPPPGSPPGTPPIEEGRFLVVPCQPSHNFQGIKLDWGQMPLEKIYGAQGWCNAHTVPIEHCSCALEKTTGDFCRYRREVFCLNQCSGHGDCNEGYCKCHEGWYGTDCSRSRAGLPMPPGIPDQVPGHLRHVMRAPTSLASPEERPARKRPYIYVYDMPPALNTRNLQYRLSPNACHWRSFSFHNNSDFKETNGYGLEIHLHEALLISPHRTFDPEEADFFYVPVYITCYMWPVMGWADYPWFHAPSHRPRPMHAANMVLDAKRWVESHHPWWKRRGGRDHIFLMPHDEGACYMPTEVYKTSIVLTHWGRMDLEHQSASGWPPDNYSEPLQMPGYQDVDWRELYKGHPCYDPKKDIVVPLYRAPTQFKLSPLLGAPPRERDILLYFRGDVGKHREVWYSRGIRQKFFKLAHTKLWRLKYDIVIGTAAEYPGEYTEHLARSKFCLVPPGDGYSARAEDAILHGCIPVIVMDNVETIWGGGVLAWELFSVRIKQGDIERTPEILREISEIKLAKMQRMLTQIWQRFVWASHPLVRHTMADIYTQNADAHKDAPPLPPDHPYKPLTRFPGRMDALATLMQVLYGRIPSTGGVLAQS